MKNKLTYSALLFALGTLCALALMIFRATHVISFVEIRHLVTSGFEEESLFAMWKFLHGLPVYTDPHQIPFSASYFNWLFYKLYGTWISFVVNVFGLEDAWIPTIGRCLTLIIDALGFIVSYRLFVNKAINDPPLPPLIALALSGLLWFSPLIGFWAMTVRPDLLALLFDTCAVFFLLKYLYPKHNTEDSSEKGAKQLFIGVIWCAFWCYLSWACKQVNIVMPVAISLFLLIQKRWQAFILFSLLIGSSYVLSLLLASKDFLRTLFFMNTANAYSFNMFGTNLVNFSKKALPAIILLFFMLIALLSHRSLVKKVWQEPMVKLSLCGIIAWAFILLPCSSKIGSADNYHFIALFFIMLGIGGTLKYLIKAPSPLLAGCFALTGIFCLASVAVVTLQGNIFSISQQHQNNVVLERCLHQLPLPIFVHHHYGALPWINPSPISFVLAFNYWQDRNANLPFEHNGIGGLINQGYFHTLVIPKYYQTQFDGAALKSFTLQEKDCAGFAIYIRSSLNLSEASCERIPRNVY